MFLVATLEGDRGKDGGRVALSLVEHHTLPHHVLTDRLTLAGWPPIRSGVSWPTMLALYVTELKQKIDVISSLLDRLSST